MIRFSNAFLTICLLAGGLVQTVHSQSLISGLAGDDEPSEVVSVSFDGKEIKVAAEQFVKLNISPKLSSVPALKHRLFPALSDLKSGDAATLYHRAILFMRQHRSATDHRRNRMKEDRGEKVPFSDQSYDELSNQLGRKFTDAELKELKQIVDGGNNIFYEIKLASGLQECDWGFDVNNGRPLLEYIAFLLPEIQDLRSLTRFLTLRARVQIESGDFEGAIETIRCGLKMAKTTEGTRFMVCALVGVGCSNLLLEQVEELIGAPNAPNLYWSLETIPQPLVSVKKSAIYELEYLRDGAGLKVFKDPEKRDASVKQWNRLMMDDLDQLAQLVGTNSLGRGKFDDIRKLQALTILMRGYPVAKRQLVKWGYDKNKVESMPAVKVLAIHESRMLKIICDEMLKVLHLEHNEAVKRFDEVANRMPTSVKIDDGKETEYEELIPLGTTLIPAVSQVLRAENRNLRRIRLLQTVEALRMHVAKNKAFPEKLAEIKNVPVPINPDNGNPFIYRKTEDGCVLWEMDPELSQKTPTFLSSKIYQIKLRDEEVK